MASTNPVQSVPASAPGMARSASREMQQHRRMQLWGIVFLSPWVIGFLAFTFFPMIASLYYSFTDFNLNNAAEINWVGLRNYANLFTDPVVATSTTATIKFAIIALPLSVILPVSLAALMNSKWLIGKPIIRTLFYMPYMVPVVSAVAIWGGMLNSESGWINRLLATIGVVGPDWLNDVGWIYPAMNIIGLWGIGNAFLIMLASMQGVPTELYEAARVDGAGPVTRFRKITLPMISPVIFYNLVLSIVGLFQYFLVPLVVNSGTGRPGGATMFYNLYLYKTFFTFQNMSYGSTMAWLLFIFILLVTILLFSTAKYWVYYAGESRS